MIRGSTMAALGLAAALLGAGFAQAAPARQCFFAKNITSWAPADSSTVNLRVNVHDYYQLKLLGECREIDWTGLGIALERRGSEWICEGQDESVLIVPTPGIGPRRCPVTSVRKLTDAEVKALPSKKRP